MDLRQKTIYTSISTVIKIVLDSNIVISALLFDGKPEQILFMASRGDIEIILTPIISEEIHNVLINKFKHSENIAKKLLKSVTSISKIVVPKIKVRSIKYLPDNKILEAGLEGQVDYIVTGDKKHLLPLKQFKGIPIITPDQILTTGIIND